jgi:hypothetical protein
VWYSAMQESLYWPQHSVHCVRENNTAPSLTYVLKTVILCIRLPPSPHILSKPGTFPFTTLLESSSASISLTHYYHLSLLQAALGIFGSSEAPAPRLQAFLAIRQLGLCMPSPFIEKCLKVRWERGSGAGGGHTAVIGYLQCLT